MNYPLSLKFKLFALAPQIVISDAGGNTIFYIKQKLFKLREAVNIFSDTSQTQHLYSINADRVLDFSARFHFTDAQGVEIGLVQREGVKSIWKATYKVFDGDRQVYVIHEENPWVKVGDALFREIPGVNILAGYVFNPSYVAQKIDSDQIVMRLKKEPSLLESSFSIDKQDPNLTGIDEQRVLLSMMQVVMLERIRG